MNITHGLLSVAGMLVLVALATLLALLIDNYPKVLAALLIIGFFAVTFLVGAGL